LITREQGSGTRITIERVLGMKFNSEIEINSNEAIIEAVQAGLGIGFVSKHTVKLELENSIMGEISDGVVVVVVVLFLFVLAILWFLLPFAIFGTKDKLSELIAETKKTNEQLSDLRSEITALKSDAK
jgi:DNA-binding transcriptional LysR family regulator